MQNEDLFDVVNLTTGEVLREGIPRMDAIKYAAKYTDENKYTMIRLDNDTRQITVEQ